jgi:hypothetical protein
MFRNVRDTAYYHMYVSHWRDNDIEVDIQTRGAEPSTPQLGKIEKADRLSR